MEICRNGYVFLKTIETVGIVISIPLFSGSFLSLGRESYCKRKLEGVGLALLPKHPKYPISFQEVMVMLGRVVFDRKKK